jgi:protein-tyrosine phosphatase
MVFVLDELAVGNYEDAIAPHPRISALLNVAAERDLDSPRATYHKVPMIDMTPIPVEQMKEAVDWIRDQIPNHTVMVFCNSGVGRSPSVVIGYLCCVLGYGFGEAVEFVARKKTDISILPNLIRTIENIKVESAG